MHPRAGSKPKQSKDEHAKTVHEMANMINRIRSLTAQVRSLTNKLTISQNMAAAGCRCFNDNVAPTFDLLCKQQLADKQALAMAQSEGQKPENIVTLDVPSLPAGETSSMQVHSLEKVPTPQVPGIPDSILTT